MLAIILTTMPQIAASYPGLTKKPSRQGLS
jgi:hypothetical protein